MNTRPVTEGEEFQTCADSWGDPVRARIVAKLEDRISRMTEFQLRDLLMVAEHMLGDRPHGFRFAADPSLARGDYILRLEAPKP